MVRTLLTERFKLDAAHEDRTLPVYERAWSEATERSVQSFVRPLPIASPRSPPCHVGVTKRIADVASRSVQHRDSPGNVKAGAIDMSQLASILSNRSTGSYVIKRRLTACLRSTSPGLPVPI